VLKYIEADPVTRIEMTVSIFAEYFLKWTNVNFPACLQSVSTLFLLPPKAASQRYMPRHDYARKASR
jgi:hypothetical protein